MRTNAILVFLAVLFSACTTTQQPPASPDASAEGPYGISDEEEALVLRLEDRREFDRTIAQQWLTHENPLHRVRMALALGRISPHAFDDANQNGEQDSGERAAGVDLLIAAATDPEYEVRRTVGFALGEIGDPAAADTLLTLARDQEHAGVAAEAVEALSKMATAVTLPRYQTLISDPRPGVRSIAIRFLFRFASDEASSVAATYLGDADSVIRREAAYSLSRRPIAGARERLELLLTDPDTLTRSFAARALGVIADVRSFDPLLQRTTDIHPWVRTNVARALTQLAEKNATLMASRDTAEDLLRLIPLSQDPDPGVVATTIDLLGWYAPKSEQAATRLRELVANGSSVQRELASAALAKQAADEQTIAALTQTDSPWVKLRLLEATAAKPAGTKLREAFAKDEAAMVRAAVLNSIAEDQLEANLPLVRTMLEDGDIVVRATAIEKLGASKTLPQEEKVALLKAAAERGASDQLNDARLSAISALAEIDYPERESMLRGLLRDRDPVVRRIASDLIVQKLGKPRPQYTPLDVTRDDYLEIARWARGPHTATIKTAKGDVLMALLTHEAPMTAWNFATLAKRGYFDGTTFMRVVPNFVAQSGDPRNDQSGGPGYSIRDEINLQKYTRGAVGMALSGPDTGGSQYFITHSPQPHLDGGYTIFGRVTEGMAGVVDQLERGDKVTTILIDDKPASANPDFSAIEKTPLPTVLGEITAVRLLADVPEYADRKSAYQADRDVVGMIASSIQPGDRIDVYLGTWCSDSQREVPKLLKLVDELERDHGVKVPLRFVAMNRGKNQPAKLVEGKHIAKVATFIVYRGDEELGRIEEQPVAVFEDEILRILSK